MNSIEKLHAYQTACKTINAVENELRKMVDAFSMIALEFGLSRASTTETSHVLHFPFQK